MRYKVMKMDLHTDYLGYQRDFEKAIHRTWLDKLLGRNEWPDLKDYHHPTTEVYKVVETAEEARKLIRMAEPWMKQSGGRMWYETIKEDNV